MKLLFGGFMLVLAGWCLAVEKDFQHELISAVKPWTDKPLVYADGKFHFVVVADRTDRTRQWVFEDAVKKINLLQPDFVICVGDLVQGYTNDRQKAIEQWNEFNAIVGLLDMRFFYVAGNHDTSKNNPGMRALWRELYGPKYYYFIYKNVLFMILHSQETREDCIGKIQADWAVAVLDKYPTVKETFIFVHYPLWQDEYLNKYQELRPLFRQLNRRNHTIFAGHEHAYMKFEKNKHRYFRMSTTGGENSIGELGRFDHFIWVSVFKDRPSIFANIMLDRIADENILTDEIGEILKEFKADRKHFIYNKDNSFELPVVIKNPHNTTLKYKINLVGNKNWSFSTPEFKGEIPVEQQISLTIKGKVETIFPLPVAVADFEIPGGSKFKIKLPVPFGLLNNSEIEAAQCSAAPVIDGRLNDKCWQLPVAGEFRDSVTFNKPRVETKVWLTYDDNYLYWAAKCYEPDKNAIVSNQVQRDFAIWHDDNMGLLLNASYSSQDYSRIIVNSANAIYATDEAGNKINADIKSAVTFDADGWMMEMAIPWKDFNVNNPGNKKMGVLFTRNRPGRERICQMPVVGIDHLVPENFGTLWLKLSAAPVAGK